jgi:hypothetical protein
VPVTDNVVVKPRRYVRGKRNISKKVSSKRDRKYDTSLFNKGIHFSDYTKPSSKQNYSTQSSSDEDDDIIEGFDWCDSSSDDFFDYYGNSQKYNEEFPEISSSDSSDESSIEPIDKEEVRNEMENRREKKNVIKEKKEKTKHVKHTNVSKVSKHKDTKLFKKEEDECVRNARNTRKRINVVGRSINSGRVGRVPTKKINTPIKHTRKTQIDNVDVSDDVIVPTTNVRRGNVKRKSILEVERRRVDTRNLSSVKFRSMVKPLLNPNLNPSQKRTFQVRTSNNITHGRIY